jgi:hypothetical protein
MPILGKLGDLANSKFVRGAAGFASPLLNGFIPGLGSAIYKGLDYVSDYGSMAKNAADDYAQNNFGIAEGLKNWASGKYKNENYQKKKIDGIKYAKRPEDLHPGIELKALPSGDENRNGSYVEELD